MTEERTHFVYEAYDADGLLLYVGCTGNPGNRYRAHMTGDGDARGWFNPFVTNWRVSGPYPKDVAFALERTKINEGQPIWNGHSVENRLKNRQLIKDYLAYHGVEFLPKEWRRPPQLVAVRPKRTRRLKAVAS